MLNFIDNFLNRITMYRLVLYYLILLLVASVVLAFMGFLPFSAWALLLSTLVILAVCYITNRFFAYVFAVPTNVESIYITALILALIITPLRIWANATPFLMFVGWASVWAMASKYIVAIRRKHLFNPAAFAVVLTSFTLGNSASWWVATLWMLPFVVVGGLLVVRKIKRFDLVFSFLSVSLAVIVGVHLLSGTSVLATLHKALVDSPILFFAFVMLTEPLTTPPTLGRQALYGAFVGLLFAPQVHVGSIYSTPELALIVGNLFSYLISPKIRLILHLNKIERVANDAYDIVFNSDQRLSFKPGQYLEWTLGHRRSDSRGNRRYFTIASSPTEKNIRIGVKFYSQPSSFKKNLTAMKAGDTIVASQLAGDFTLPRDSRRKLVFIAGGIGITPFRSMIKYLLDKKERRDIKMLYSNKTSADIAYRDILDIASRDLGIETTYVLTYSDALGTKPTDYVGRIDADLIKSRIPDYQERIFYLSGPRSMVVYFEKVLRDMGVKKSQIKIDFFPGFA